MLYFGTVVTAFGVAVMQPSLPPLVVVGANTDPGATFLGDEQWKWLEEQLKKPAEVRLLVSSIQVISDDHPFEKWMNIPKEREKLYALLNTTQANGVIILSGDRHLAEVSLDTKAIGYPLYDVTSSGFNQASKNWRAPEKNEHRVAVMPYGDNFVAHVDSMRVLAGAHLRIPAP